MEETKINSKRARSRKHNNNEKTNEMNVSNNDSILKHANRTESEQTRKLRNRKCPVEEENSSNMIEKTCSKRKKFSRKNETSPVSLDLECSSANSSYENRPPLLPNQQLSNTSQQAVVEKSKRKRRRNAKNRKREVSQSTDQSTEETVLGKTRQKNLSTQKRKKSIAVKDIKFEGDVLCKENITKTIRHKNESVQKKVVIEGALEKISPRNDFREANSYAFDNDKFETSDRRRETYDIENSTVFIPSVVKSKKVVSDTPFVNLSSINTRLNNMKRQNALDISMTHSNSPKSTIIQLTGSIQEVKSPTHMNTTTLFIDSLSPQMLSELSNKAATAGSWKNVSKNKMSSVILLNKSADSKTVVENSPKKTLNKSKDTGTLKKHKRRTHSIDAADSILQNHSKCEISDGENDKNQTNTNDHTAEKILNTTGEFKATVEKLSNKNDTGTTKKNKRTTYSIDATDTILQNHSKYAISDEENDKIQNKTCNSHTQEKISLKEEGSISNTPGYQNFVTHRKPSILNWNNFSLAAETPQDDVFESASYKSPHISLNKSKKRSLNQKLSHEKRPTPNVKLSRSLKATPKANVMKTPRLSSEKTKKLSNLVTKNDNALHFLTRTSTPAMKKTLDSSSLIKSMVDKKKNVSFSQEVKIGSVKKNKMPNFASIHRRQFEKMESIGDYKERKEERAKLLLSGKKPPTSFSEKTPNAQDGSVMQDSLNHSKKEVKYSKQREFQERAENNINGTTTPKKTPHTPNKLKFVIQENKIKTSKITPNKLKPVFQDSSKAAGLSKVAKPLPFLATQASTSGTTHTRFGFPLAQRVTKKPIKEELKMLVNKTRILKGTEKRREVLKGVRSNRRFDLLMAMRAKEL